MYHFDSPAGLSLHEEVTFAALGPAMGLFKNLVMFDQHVLRDGFNSIVPDLATKWSWDSSQPSFAFGCTRASNGTTGCRWRPGPAR
jgi:peptide/nickel transport system substrate-binding protein